MYGKSSQSTTIWLNSTPASLHSITRNKQHLRSPTLPDSSSRGEKGTQVSIEPAGSSELSTDAGWGCTLRSGQMLLAQGLQQHCVGRAWRRHADTPLPEALSRLLRWFWDEPSPQYPFSIHNLCAAGRPHG